MSTPPTEPGPANAASCDATLPPPKRLAPTSLPCLLRAPLQFVFYDLLNEDDGFVDTMRKGGAAVGLVVGFFVVIAVLGNYIEAQSMTTALAVYLAVSIFASIAWTVTYLVVRWTTCDPGSAMGVMLVVSALVTSLCLTATMETPFHLTFVYTVFLAALLNLPYKWAWFTACFLPYMASSYNHAMRSMTFDFPPLLLPDATETALSPVSRLGPYAAYYWFGVVIALVFYQVHAEYARSIEQSRASAKLASSVATLLASYDTEAAREALRNADAAGAALVAALSVMVDNLEAYRPHLPNWMLTSAASSKESEHGGQGADLDMADTRSNATSARSKRSSHSAHSRRHEHLPKPTAHAPTDSIRTHTVVRARLAFRVQRVAGTSRDVAKLASAFVDAVHDAARNTKAAVHSFLGDTVDLTWNAVASATSAGAKATRFLARVRAASERLNNHTHNNSNPSSGTNTKSLSEAAAQAPTASCSVGGGAVSCRAKIQMAGSSAAQKVLLLSVADDSDATLAVLVAAGQRYGAMLATLPVAGEAVDIATCPVATVRDASSGNDDAGFVPVHQVCHELLPDGGTGDTIDWLFMAQGSPGVPAAPGQHPSPTATIEGAREGANAPLHVVVSRAYDLAVRQRRIGAACRELDTLSKEDVSQWPLVARLSAALRAQSERPSTAAGEPLSANLSLEHA